MLVAGTGSQGREGRPEEHAERASVTAALFAQEYAGALGGDGKGQILEVLASVTWIFERNSCARRGAVA